MNHRGARLGVRVAFLALAMAAPASSAAPGGEGAVLPPEMIDLRLADSSRVVEITQSQRHDLARHAAQDLLQRASDQHDRLFVLRVRGAELSPRSGLGAPDDEAARHERRMADFLNLVLDELKEHGGDREVSILGLPVEPGRDGRASARAANKSFTEVIGRLDAFIATRGFLLSGSPGSVDATLRRALPEAFRLEDDRPLYYRANGVWQIQGDAPDSGLTTNLAGDGSMSGGGSMMGQLGDDPRLTSRKRRPSGDAADDSGNDSTDGGDDNGSDNGNDDSSDSDSFWTDLEPSSDSRIIHVSSSSGSDSNHGLSPDAPVRTLGRGLDLMRDGYPDWLLLKRGEVWEDESFGTWRISGRSPAEMMVISAYGEGDARPLVRTGVQHGLQTKISEVIRHLAIIGVHLQADGRDGSDSATGIRWLSSGGNLLVEDCVIEGYKDNIVLQDVPGSGLHDIRIRRSIVTDSFAVGSHSQGLYCSGVNGIVVEECVFDHNGWNDDVPGAEPTDFNHNIYMRANCENAVLRGNIIANGSSAGLQARGGGLVQDNLFISNPISLRFGGGDEPKPGGVHGAIRGNLFLDGDDILSNLPRGHAMTLQNVAFADVRNNIVANDASDAPYGHAVYFEGDRSGEVGVHNITFEHNTVYNWRGGLKFKGTPGVDLSGLQLAYNIIQIEQSEGRLVRHMDDVNPDEMFYLNNIYHLNRPPTKWFEVQSVSYAFEQWAAQSDDTGSNPMDVDFLDASRTIASYQDSVGGAVGVDGFLSEARSQSRAHWNPLCTSLAVADYFMVGFQPQGDLGDGGSGATN